jgi:hypothetical protein
MASKHSLAELGQEPQSLSALEELKHRRRQLQSGLHSLYRLKPPSSKPTTGSQPAAPLILQSARCGSHAQKPDLKAFVENAKHSTFSSQQPSLYREETRLTPAAEPLHLLSALESYSVSSFILQDLVFPSKTTG